MLMSCKLDAESSTYSFTGPDDHLTSIYHGKHGNRLYTFKKTLVFPIWKSIPCSTVLQIFSEADRHSSLCEGPIPSAKILYLSTKSLKRCLIGYPARLILIVSIIPEYLSCLQHSSLSNSWKIKHNNAYHTRISQLSVKILKN